MAVEPKRGLVGGIFVNRFLRGGVDDEFQFKAFRRVAYSLDMPAAIEQAVLDFGRFLPGLGEGDVIRYKGVDFFILKPL